MIGLLNKTRSYPALLFALAVIPISVLACATQINGSVHSGDAVAGKNIYQRCIGCHSFTENRTGPKHCGLFGRKAGSVPNFNYSNAMRNSGITWGDATLDAFLKSPLENVPNTIMGYAGVKNDQERWDLIAYLKQESQSSACK